MGRIAVASLQQKEQGGERYGRYPSPVLSTPIMTGPGVGQQRAAARHPAYKFEAAQDVLRVVLGLPTGIQPELIDFGVIIIGREIAGLALGWARWS